MPLRTAIPFLLAAASLASGASAQSIARRDTAVKTAGAPIHAKPGSLVEEQGIGVVDGADEYVFGDIADMALGADGSLFVLDRKIPIVRQYDAAGKFIRNIGRSGSGPGEYRSASGIATMRDGRLLLWDTGNWRVNLYSPTGQFVTQWLTPAASANSSATYSRALLVDSAGTAWCRGTVIKRTPEGVTRRSVWLRVDAGGVRDTVEEPVMPAPSNALQASAGNASATAALPFAPQPLIAKNPFGGFITAFPSRYAFELLGAGGSITSIRRDGVRPLAVPSDERAAQRERIETMMKRMDPSWTWSGPEIPSTRPFFSGIAAGLDGRIWLAVIPEVSPRPGSINTPLIGGAGRPGAPQAPRGPVGERVIESKPALYDVYEPDGRLLGSVQIPPRVSTVLRRGDQVWAIAYNDDDVPTIKRYKIRWE